MAIEASMTPPTAVPLRGDVVRLRPVTSHDAARLTEILTHPGVAQWWGDYDLDQVQREVIDRADGTVTYAVEADGEVIGLVQYSEEDDPEYRHAGIDVSLHPAWHGRGLGADAVRTVARSGPWPGTCSSSVGITASRSTRRPTISGRSAATSGWGSGQSGSCAATSGARTAAGTTVS